MPAAACPYCGNQVMPYRRYAFYLKRGATCASCGRSVRVRGYLFALISGVLLVGAMTGYFVTGDRSLSETLVVLAAFGLLAVVLDYTFWRWVGFTAGSEAPSAHPVEHDTGTPTGA